MRRWAFVLMLAGIFVLVFVGEFSSVQVSSLEDLSGFELNQKVSLSGTVVSERVIYSGTRLLVLDVGDSEIELVCECGSSYLDDFVFVRGLVSEYEGKRQVEVLEIVS